MMDAVTMQVSVVNVKAAHCDKVKSVTKQIGFTTIVDVKIKFA